MTIVLLLSRRQIIDNEENENEFCHFT